MNNRIEVKAFQVIFSEIISQNTKIVILGVGSKMNGDDAAGPFIAESLVKTAEKYCPGKVMVYNGGMTPENFTGDIKRFKPDLLFLIDAADFGETTGSISLLNIRNTEGVSFSSHMLPLRIMIDYIERETGCKTRILGIQPLSVGYGEEMSEKVARTVKDVIRIMKNEIKRIR